MKVLVSGASVAGPAVAHWLGRYGYDVTVVEIAPALREGGYAVDFRGPVNREVLSRMGVLEDLKARQTGGSPMRFVDAAGRQLMVSSPGENWRSCGRICPGCCTSTPATGRRTGSGTRSRV